MRSRPSRSSTFGAHPSSSVARASAGAVFEVEEDDLDALAALVADRAGIAVDLASAVTVGAAREGVGSGVLDPAARTVVG